MITGGDATDATIEVSDGATVRITAPIRVVLMSVNFRLRRTGMQWDHGPDIAAAETEFSSGWDPLDAIRPIQP